MQMLGDDDLELRGMSDEELASAWELWFRLMQHTNDADPLYTHGVFAYATPAELGLEPASCRKTAPARAQRRARP